MADDDLSRRQFLVLTGSTVATSCFGVSCSNGDTSGTVVQPTALVQPEVRASGDGRLDTRQLLGHPERSKGEGSSATCNFCCPRGVMAFTSSA